MTILNAAQWDSFLAGHPETHVLQSSAWGELKSAFGWSPVRVQAGDCGAQILFRKLPMGLTIGYIPKGPVGSPWQALWAEVDAVCKVHHAVFLKIEPDLWTEHQVADAENLPGVVPADPIQPRRTIEIDLTGSEEEWLARMRQKTRYNVRLAEKKGVTVRESSDIAGFHQLMMQTGERDVFGVHSLAYYQRAYDLFSVRGACALLVAEYDHTPLAGLMVFSQGQRAWYFYGASGNVERNRMPAYLLQFAAMRWAASRGCQLYDLWGIPDADEEKLERDFDQRTEGLWGVYRFKRGFGGKVRRSIGAWDKVYRPRLYKAYRIFAARRGSE